MRRDSWFDRTFGTLTERAVAADEANPGDGHGFGSPARSVSASDGAIECNGKCRKGAIDPDCRLHGIWRLP